jgi:hypothetical protein
MEIRTIAIVLGDNDFGNTFRPLLEGLKPIFDYRDGNLTPKQCELIIIQSIMAYYVGYQYSFFLQSYGNIGEDHLERTAKYLKDIKVLFNEDAEQDISTADHDGGAWYLELQSGTVSGY